jgi:NAD-dependent DNA ligase
MLSIISDPKTSSSQIIEALKKLNESEFQELLDKLSDAYHNEEPLVSDEQYDLFESIFISRFGKELKIGAPPPREDRKDEKNEDEKSSKRKPPKQDKKGIIIRPSGARVQVSALPIPLFGLNKPNDDHELKLFHDRCQTLKELDDKKTGNLDPLKFVLTEKLDGCAGYLSIGPNESRLIKRGNEKEGTDISYLLPYLSLPKLDHQMIVKVELVMPRKVWQEKYSEEYKNPRNMVAGITNAKEIEAEKIRDLHVVAFHIYNEDLPNYQRLEPLTMLSKLRSLKFRVPAYDTISSGNLSVDYLTSWIKKHRLESEYEIDGLCVALNIVREYDSDKNPQHIAAFKIAGEKAVTEIIEIQWEISKHGLYIPTARVKPVQISGATIQRVTCYHANFVRDEGLGPGAKIVLIRSGETIPKIFQVIDKTKPQYPEKDWNWVVTDDGSDPVDIYFTGNKSSEQEISRIYAFFKERGAEYLGEKTIARLYEGGFDSLKKLFGAEIQDIIKIPGFKTKSAERVVANIKNAITNAPLAEIMAGSCLFPSLGAKRLRLIIEAIPDLLEINSSGELDDARKKIIKIGGLGEKLSQIWENNFLDFKSWLKEHSEIQLENSADENDSFTVPIRGSAKHSERQTLSLQPFANSIEIKTISQGARGNEAPPKKLEDQIVAFTGCRPDRLMERAINQAGGKVASSVTSKTTILVVKNRDKITKKMEKAEEQGVKIVSWEEWSAEWSV